MTHIPEDIQKAARDVVHDYPPIVRQCLHDIERALLRERKRCYGEVAGMADAADASASRAPDIIREVLAETQAKILRIVADRIMSPDKTESPT